MEEMEAVEIAYLRRTGPYGPENRQLMERLKAFLKERGQDGVRDRPAGDRPGRSQQNSAGPVPV